MSYVIDAASKINDLQLKAVIEGQNAVVEFARTAAEFVDRAPGATESVQKLVEPIESVVGGPTEFVRSIAQSNNEWAQAWLDFNNRISEVLTQAAESAADEPTPIKKPSTTRRSKTR
jgi:hypothetical protein